MSYEAIVNGLLMNHFRGMWEQPDYKPSMTRVWKLLEYIPIKRLSYSSEKDKQDKEITQRWCVVG
jgi:hypothetical protein